MPPGRLPRDVIDGTVRFVDENLNMSVFQLLGHRADRRASTGFND